MARKSKRRGELVSALQLSKLIGRDRASLRVWVDEEGMPYHSRPDENGAGDWQFYTAEVIDWLVERDVQKVMDEYAKPDGLDLDNLSKADAEREKATWSARKEKASALTAELNLRERLGEVVEIENVGAIFNAKIVKIKTAFLDLSAKASNKIDDVSVRPQVIKAVDDGVSEILGDLSNFSRKDL